jgi:hypothetical protein
MLQPPSDICPLATETRKNRRLFEDRIQTLHHGTHRQILAGSKEPHELRFWGQRLAQT